MPTNAEHVLADTSAALALVQRESGLLLEEFAAAGLAGGALYDGLVAAAREHTLLLITCDRRAEPTYRALGVAFEPLRP